MEDIRRIAIPTPFDVGRVNCYLFGNGEPTLLDPGPATEEAYETVVAHLDEGGHAIEDVARILITHPHIDHFGLADRIVEESGARVVAHRNAVPLMADPNGYLKREQDFFTPFLTSMGVSERIVDTVVALPGPYTEFRDPVEVDRGLKDGDVVDVHGGLTAVHTPGHAPGSVCFVSASDSIAYTGDHVLEHISPNPVLTLAPGTDDERTRSLPLYLDSSCTLLETDATVGHSGHGDRISDLEARIDEVLDHHRRRKERIAGIVDERVPVTAYELMKEMFSDLPLKEVFLGMSEIIGHLDLLEDEDRVTITESDRVRRYKLQ